MVAYHAERAWILRRTVGATSAVLIATGVVAAAVLALGAWAAKSRPGGRGLYALLAAQVLAACNVAALLVLAVREAAYQPGLLTGALLVLPATAFLVERLLAEGSVQRRATLRLALGVAAAYVALAWSLPGFLAWLDRCTGCA
jgi:hypothetical protein